MTLQILLISDSPEHTEIMESVLAQSGNHILCKLDVEGDWYSKTHQSSADVICFCLKIPTQTTLREIHKLTSASPRPVIIFAEEGNRSTIAEATHAGVSSYVVDGFSGERIRRIKAILTAAIARFKEVQALRLELDVTRARLEERKIIERAKGLLMKQRNYSEDDAYKALRKLAMDRNTRLIDVANSVVNMAELMG